jgi:CRP-like cAMP-binding protein
VTRAGFLAGLDEAARELFLAAAQPCSFMKGSTLVRQGEPTRGAYVLREGGAEARVRLPGGESLVVANIGPGDIFGEMALIELGTCTATVAATQNVDGWFIAHEDFRALVSHRHPAAFAIQHAVTLVLAAKLAALNARVAVCAAREDCAARIIEAQDPLAGYARSRHAPFAADAFLLRLPFFERFDADDVADLTSRGAFVELPRGAPIFRAGGEAKATFFVVRGAVEIVAAQRECERRMAVLGPGQLVGFMSVLQRSRHSANAYAREAALLLELPAAVFHELYFGTATGASGASMHLRNAVQKSLLASMGRTNRMLTRLIAQKELETRPGAARELERLAIV